MIPKEKAKDLVNQKYYQPLTLYLNLNNNSTQMWNYAKRCAFIAVEEIIAVCQSDESAIITQLQYWQEVKQEIEKL